MLTTLNQLQIDLPIKAVITDLLVISCTVITGMLSTSDKTVYNVSGLSLGVEDCGLRLGLEDSGLVFMTWTTLDWIQSVICSHNERTS